VRAVGEVQGLRQSGLVEEAVLVMNKVQGLR